MSKVMGGARAKCYIDNVLVGIFESVNVSNSTGLEEIHIIGRYTPDEITITHKNGVNISCSGFRVVGQGKHVLPKVPKVQDLLGFQPFTMAIVDRQTGQTVETILGVTPASDNTNYNAKATSRVNINYMGIRASDESGAQDESAGAVSLP